MLAQAGEGADGRRAPAAGRAAHQAVGADVGCREAPRDGPAAQERAERAPRRGVGRRRGAQAGDGTHPPHDMGDTPGRAARPAGQRRGGRGSARPRRPRRDRRRAARRRRRGRGPRRPRGLRPDGDPTAVLASRPERVVVAGGDGSSARPPTWPRGWASSSPSCRRARRTTSPGRSACPSTSRPRSRWPAGGPDARRPSTWRAPATAPSSTRPVRACRSSPPGTRTTSSPASARSPTPWARCAPASPPGRCASACASTGGGVRRRGLAGHRRPATGAFGGGAELEVADEADRRLDVAVLRAGPRAALVRRAWGMRRGGLAGQAASCTPGAGSSRSTARRRSTSTARCCG